MKRKLCLGLAMLAVILGGCVVQSVQSLFSDRDLIEYPPLVGTWKQQDGDKEVGLWIFSKQDQRYKLTHTDEKGHKGTFMVAAGKLGTNVFLDFVPDDPLPGSELNGLTVAGLIPVHVFVKAVKTNDALLLLAMDYEWMEKYLKTNSSALSHVMVENRPILTASTEQLQAFVAKYASDEKVFKNEVRLLPRK